MRDQGHGENLFREREKKQGEKHESDRVNFWSNPKSVGIWMCQNLTVSESKVAKIFKYIQILTHTFWFSNILATLDSNPFWFLTLSDSDTLWFWHSLILTLSDSDTFRFWHFPDLKIFHTLSSDTLRFQRILTLSGSDTIRFWHYPVLTLSGSDTFRFLHFQILTHSDSDTFRIEPKLSKIGILTLSDLFLSSWKTVCVWLAVKSYRNKAGKVFNPWIIPHGPWGL